MRCFALGSVLACALLCLWGPPALGERIVLGLSKDKVAITATFDGSEILVFGAVNRQAPIPAGAPLQAIISISGPSAAVWVRRKARRFGLWVNTDSVLVDSAPSFYAVATSAPFREVISDTEDLRHRVSVERAIRSVGADMHIQRSQDFTEALVRIRKGESLYQHIEGGVQLHEQTLFNTSIALPANLVEGTYQVRILLTRGGRVIAELTEPIDVRKVGLERWLYRLSRQQPLVYGLLSLVIAIAAGWGASAAFRAVLRRS